MIFIYSDFGRLWRSHRLHRIYSYSENIVTRDFHDKTSRFFSDVNVIDANHFYWLLPACQCNEKHEYFNRHFISSESSQFTIKYGSRMKNSFLIIHFFIEPDGDFLNLKMLRKPQNFL